MPFGTQKIPFANYPQFRFPGKRETWIVSVGTNWKSGFDEAIAWLYHIRLFVAVAVVLDQWGYRSLCS